MDMSKLPRLSQSPQPPPQPQSPQEQQSGTQPDRPVDFGRAERIGTGAEIWISAAIGLILMLVGRQFGTYLISLVTHEAFHTNVTWTSGPKAGQEVSYPELQGFVMLTDASMWLFGLTMVFDAAILFFAGGRRAWLVVVGFGLTVAVCVFNGFVCAKLFSAGVTPIMSLMALAFGIYMSIYQWGLLKEVLAAQDFARAAGKTG